MPIHSPAPEHEYGSENEVSPTERAFHVIELVARSRTVSTVDLMSALGIPKTTAHRLIGNLEELGFLQHGIERGRYQVGPRLLELATSILSGTAAHGPIHALLMELSRRTTETCSLAVMRGAEVVYIDSVIGNSPLTFQFQQGQRAPLHCTSSGRVFLAHSEKKQLEAFLLSGPWEPITPYTIVDPDRLRQEIALVRKQGYASNDSEFAIGVVGAAVPVFGQNDRVVACLSLSAPKARKSLEDMVLYVPQLQSVANRIARILTLQSEDGASDPDQAENAAPRTATRRRKG
jgi:DNA-binding IclR family transcriptional regulator